MPKLILFNKPYGVLTQFTDQEDRPTLANYIQQKGVYPAGRLDRDSEGLLLLTDDGKLAHQLTHPDKKTWKTYQVQVEGTPSKAALKSLADGLQLKDGMTLPAKVKLIQPAKIAARNPPVRYRANIPTCWLQIKIREGRNRQVRRMTATVGHPTLRLIRVAIGQWQLLDLPSGEMKTLQVP